MPDEIKENIFYTIKTETVMNDNNEIMILDSVERYIREK